MARMRCPRTAFTLALVAVASAASARIAQGQAPEPPDSVPMEVLSPMTTELGLGTAVEAEGPVLPSLHEGEKAFRIFRHIGRAPTVPIEIRWISVSRTTVGDEVVLKILAPLATERRRQIVDLTVSLIGTGRVFASEKIERIELRGGRGSRSKTIAVELRLSKADWDEMFVPILSPSLRVSLSVVE